MHKVQPNIHIITELTYFPLGSITVFTLWNKGTSNMTYSFGDVTEVLKPGQTVTFDAGANTVFTGDSKLVIDFIGKDLINYCSIQFNKLTQASKAFADIGEK